MFSFNYPGMRLKCFLHKIICLCVCGCLRQYGGGHVLCIIVDVVGLGLCCGCLPTLLFPCQLLHGDIK